MIKEKKMKFNVSKNSEPAKYSVFNFICTALLLGALWGFFEVFFKDVLSMGGKPFVAALMTGIGVAIMAAGYGLFKRAGMFFAIAVFTVFARMIIVPVLGCSPMCRANAVVALLLLGASTTLAFGLSAKYLKNSARTGGIAAGTGVLFSGVLFYYAGMACAPCQYLLNFATSGGLATFMSTEVIYWVLFSAILFYPGYLVGVNARDSVNSIREHRPVPYYLGMISASVVMMLFTGFILLP